LLAFESEMGAVLKVGILGPVEAWIDERQLPLGGRRQLALFAFLVLNANRAISSDELLAAVWRADRDGSAGKRLSVAISRLRGVLEPRRRDAEHPLRTVRGGYMLALAAEQLDAAEFETFLRAGRRALQSGDAARAREQLRAALALWRGPALAQVALEDFTQPEIRRLEELRLEALEARIDAELELGVSGGLVGELESLLARHPERERVAWQLMVALYRSGRQTDALEVYQRTRTHLVSELGLEPGPGLRALQSQILEQAPVLQARTGVPQGSAIERLIPGELVTMLIAEVESPVSPTQEQREQDREVVAGVIELLRGAWVDRAGVEALERRDGVLAVFASPQAALEAALQAREVPASVQWPAGTHLRVRIGVHTGQLRVSGAGYWGEDVQYAVRLAEAAHGGQILVSAVTAALAPDQALMDLGEYRLNGFPVPRRLFGLGAGPHPLPRAVDHFRSNLPGVHGELIGRDREHSEVVEALRSGQSRLVTITGSGGSGKTRLALAVAEAIVDVLADGAFFVPLAQVSKPGDVAVAIAASLGIHLQAAGDHAEAIRLALSDRKLLVVLDNFEHVLGAAPMIAALVAGAPQLRVMVTSQAPLRIRGELVFALGPLELPRADDEATVAAAPASRLLLERAREADPSFRLTAENAHSVAQLARALAGLPLAIELAAARLTLLSPSALLTRLDEGIEAVGHGPRDLPARQRGLRAALDWTHGLLTDDEATLLRRLAVFAGPVSLERLERVCGDGIDALESLAQLVDLSLVTRADDGRFLLHAAVRDYARKKQIAAGESGALARRHAEALAEAARSWGDRFLFDAGAVQSAVLREEADIGQALTWAAPTNQECFARLAGGAAMPLLFAARLMPWNEVIEDALAADSLTGEPRVWLLLAGSLAAFQREDVQVARARLLSTIAAADAAGDLRLACLMGACSIIFHVLTGATDGVRDEHALLSERVSGLHDRELQLLVEGLEPYILGYCERRYPEAAAIWAAQIADRSRTDFAGWTALYCLPDCRLLEGDYEGALDGFRATLRSARELARPGTVAYQLEGILMALSGLGRHDEALEAAGWAETVRQAAGPAVNSWYKEMIGSARQTSRAALGSKPADAAFSRGRALTLDAAVNAALAADRVTEGA